MARSRLAVALLVPEPWCHEVDGLRRALGDAALARIGPHVTLVPPVNVRDDRRAEALAVVRAAAASTPPLTLTLGPVATFWPDSPVLYLAVGGDEADLTALRALRDRLFREPLHVQETWPFVPHVTVAGETSPEAIERAVATLAGYRADVELTHVALLEAQEADGAPRRWVPVTEIELGGTRTVGRGGLPVELTVSTAPDPEAGVGGVVVTARREDAVVGSATARVVGDDLVVDALEVVPAARRQGIGTHLMRAIERLAADRGCARIVAVQHLDGPAGTWLTASGWTAEQGPDLGVWVRRVGP